MPNLPPWAWTGVAGLIIGGLVTGTIAIQLSPNYNTNESSKPSSTDSLPSNAVKQAEKIEDLIIIVMDGKNKKELEDVELKITVAQGLFSGRTLSNGTFRFQIPQQKLGEFKILLNKPGYKQKEIPINFSINPNQPKRIYLEPNSPESTEKNENSSLNSDITLNEKQISSIPESESNQYPTFQVKLESNKKIYGAQEPISVKYSFYGVPESYKQWITIVLSSASEGSYSRNREFVNKSGVTTFGGVRAGNYEIRAHIRDKRNRSSLIGREAIKVE